MSSKGLPHCDDVFMKFFDPWYSQEDRKRKPFKATKPDVYQTAKPGTPADKLAVLTEAGRREAARQIVTMQDAARGDWPSMLGVKGDITLNWVQAFDEHFDRARVAQVLSRSDPTEYSNDCVVLCCEFGAAMSYVLQSSCTQLAWRYDWPYWESALLDVPSGNLLNVFHWAIKKFSDYGVDDGFAEKISMTLGLIKSGWKS